MAIVIRHIPISGRGIVGESHPKATLTDHDCELIRQLREDHGMPYWKIADKFDSPIRTIRDICNYKRRCATPTAYKTIIVEG